METLGSVVIKLLITIGTCYGIQKLFFRSKDPSENVVLNPERRIVCSSINERKVLRVAIIGSGASGAAAAYWLRKIVADPQQLELIVYERNDAVGGRVGLVEFADRKYETGATIFHNRNKYLDGFVRLFNFTKMPTKKKNSRSGIFDGNKFVFRSCGWNAVDSFIMLWKFGFWPLTRLSRCVKEMLTKFDSIYSLQRSGRSFTCPQDLVCAFAGSAGLAALRANGESHLISAFDLPRSYDGASAKVARHLVSAGTRCNYGQTCKQLNGVCAQVSCAGTQSDELFSISGGNIQLIKKLLDVSKARLCLSSTVKSILRTSDEGCGSKYVIQVELSPPSSSSSSSSGSMGGSSEAVAEMICATDNVFDAVIVACPIEGHAAMQDIANVATVSNATTALPPNDITITASGRGNDRNLSDVALIRGFNMHRTVVTFVQGVLIDKFRGLSAVYTEATAAGEDSSSGTPPLPWNSVGILFPVDAKMDECLRICADAQKGKETSVFKVFSQRILSEEELKTYLFAKIIKFEVVADWFAYPHYGMDVVAQPMGSSDASSSASSSSSHSGHVGVDNCHPFVLSPGVFSSCAIERVSSAVEMALIGGFNAALLVRDHLIANNLAVPAN